MFSTVFPMSCKYLRLFYKRLQLFFTILQVLTIVYRCFTRVWFYLSLFYLATINGRQCDNVLQDESLNNCFPLFYKCLQLFFTVLQVFTTVIQRITIVLHCFTRDRFCLYYFINRHQCDNALQEESLHIQL